MAGRRPTKRQREYMLKLRNPRWQEKKNGVLLRDAYTCTWCGSGLYDDRNLQVHHGYYAKGLEPWDYPAESLFTLCKRCHEQAESVKVELTAKLGHLAPKHQHHVFYFIEELLQHLADGGEVQALDVPWMPKREEVA